MVVDAFENDFRRCRHQGGDAVGQWHLNQMTVANFEKERVVFNFGTKPHSHESENDMMALESTINNQAP